MSTTPVPREIEHLDFDPEPEKPITCRLNRSHEFDDTKHPCGRPAVWKITVQPKCGDTSTFTLCKGCWAAVQANPARYEWRCKGGNVGTKNPPCGSDFVVVTALKSLEAIGG